jgi:hypothetical protein
LKLADEFVINVEADLDLKSLDQMRAGAQWVGSGIMSGINIDVRPTEEGHGFGLTEILEVGISVGTAVSADLIVDAIRAAVKGTIRRVKRGDHEEDGTKSGIKNVIQEARDELNSDS